MRPERWSVYNPTSLTGDNEGLPLCLLVPEDESSLNWKLPLEDALV